MFAVKEAVFPFNKFPNSDLLLGPEMKSTGEVMQIDNDMEAACIKCQMAASNPLPDKGRLFVSVKDSDKAKVLPTVRSFIKQGFKIFATSGTIKASIKLVKRSKATIRGIIVLLELSFLNGRSRIKEKLISLEKVNTQSTLFPLQFENWKED